VGYDKLIIKLVTGYRKTKNLIKFLPIVSALQQSSA